MNIGIVCYPTFGGSGVVATELGIELACRGNRVHFITHRQPARLAGAFTPNVFFHEVRMYEYPLFEFIPYESVFVSRLVDVVIHQNIDLLHLHYAIPFASIGYLLQEILARQNRFVPIVTTLHGTDITLLGKSGSFAPVVEFSINHSTAITAVSTYLREKAFETFRLTKNIQVIHNFIDPARFCMSASQRQQLRERFARNDQKIVSHISNFRPVKRAKDVMKVFVELVKHMPAKLLFIGDGPERSLIEESCRNCHLSNHILFLGKQERVEELLQISDLFILPSEMESFGLAALEAMAGGVPILTTDIGGFPELNQHGKTGFLAPLGDVDTMVGYARQILSDGKLHRQMSQSAYERAQDFHKNHILPQYLNLYASLLSNQGG